MEMVRSVSKRAFVKLGGNSGEVEVDETFIGGKARNMHKDVHARRTCLLFQKALGHDVAVGVIAVTNPDYDASHWWRYSEGVKDVFAESVAYIYARLLFFYPPDSGH